MNPLHSAFRLTLAVGLVIATTFPAAASPLLLEFAPASQTVAAGGQARVEVWLREPGGSLPLIGSYDVFVQFDPAVLSLPADPVTFDGGLGGPLDSLQFTDVAAGLVEVGEVSFLPPSALGLLQPGSPQLRLFTLSFSAIGTGSSVLSFFDVVVGDEYGTPLPVSGVDAVVTVESTPVPEPGSLFLICAGSIGLTRLRRRPSVRR
jgi:hypothetical protein